METYDIGDRPVVTGYFTEIGTGDPADPSAITVKVRHPDGTIDEYDETVLDNPAVGTWVFTFPAPLDDDGQWVVKFYGTAGLEAADELVFGVDCSKVDV